VDLQDVEPIGMLADDELTDDELAAIALDADPDVEVGDDATSLWDLIASGPSGALPQWYMPSPLAGVRSHPRPHSRWRRRVALVVISSFVIIDAYGLCATYGPLVLA
jgi:hypothetical protein